MNLKHFLALLPCLALCALTQASAIKQANRSPRESMELKVWQFAEDTEASSKPAPPPVSARWQKVAVPHVFRQSGLPDNAAGWYRQSVSWTEADRNRRLYLMMEGAASVKDVYVNGTHIGQHKGSFSASAFDLTSALRIGKPNTLDVRVSNRDEESQNCFARSTLYYVNGGMFRKARLVKTAAVHIFPEMGSSGVFLTPLAISSAGAELKTATIVRNTNRTSTAMTVRHSVTDPRGRLCTQFSASKKIGPDETVNVQASGTVGNPILWDIRKPDLYSVRTEIIVNGKVQDVITERIGFRTIAILNNRFFINGRETQFRGVNKHAQNEYVWNAVSDDDLRREWQTMDNLGVNMVRLAHYPHSRLEYDIADEHGLVVWAENGYAGQLWSGPGNEEKSITPDGERLTREMVRQNWNHPSILFWSAGNETMLDVAGHYADLIRKENDPTRLVTYAATGDQQLKNCDFVAYNTYDGWYTDGPYTDFTRSPHNDMVAETGSGDWITHHIPYGAIQFAVDKFEPEEYAEMFTEYRLQTVFRNAIADHPMFLWWNFREFYNLKFKQNRNTKGLLTLAGMPKDIFYLFKAFFNPQDPVVHLCGRHNFIRTAAITPAGRSHTGIKAYSNARELQLILNGTALEKISNNRYRIPDAEHKKKDGSIAPVSGIPVENVFFWNAPLKPGRNIIEVTDGRGHSDRMILYRESVQETDSGAIVQELQSSNPANPALFIDRPVEAQGPVYRDTDGSSDNTFDILPKEIAGAAWITTRRMSDPALKTDLEFRINPSSKGATVYVLFSTGDFPTVTLKPQDPEIQAAAGALQQSLIASGFLSGGNRAVWRDHHLNRAYAELRYRRMKPGEKIRIPGQTLDYAVLIRAEK